MRRRQFTTLLARPRLISGQINPVHLIAVLSGIAYMLTSLSALPQASQQTRRTRQGSRHFNNACRTCHMVKDGGNRLGLHLHKVIGRQAGSLPDYSYSSAMKEADFAWDKQKLERFIANPDEVVPGNRMKPYTGLASSDDR
jgi:cytochrome c